MRTRKHGWKLTSIVVVAMSILLATLTGMLYGHEPAIADPSIDLTSLAISKPVEHRTSKIESAPNWQVVIIHRHDTLSHIFSRLRIKQNELYYFTQHYKKVIILHPGNTLYFQIKSDHTLLALKYPISTEKN